MSTIASYSAPFQRIPGPREDRLIIAEHASNAVPPELQGLGVHPEVLLDHVAFDPGAAQVVAELAERLQCPAMLGGVSRLVVDLNRAETDPTLILAKSDGVTVPGNVNLSDAERHRRIFQYHRPYHQAVASTIDQRIQAGLPLTVISIHSFTPVLNGFVRPWDIGLLWKVAREPVAPIMAALRQRGHIVGDNQPYDGRSEMGHALETHGVARQLPHVMFEIRNNLIRDRTGQQYWANEIAWCLAESGLLSR